MSTTADQTTVRERLLMNPGWKFRRGDVAQARPHEHGETYSSVKTGYAGGPAGRDFDETGWREVDLPHDWVVEDEVFDPEENLSHGFKRTGVGWYRKRFALPAEDRGRRLRLEFDGVFRNSTVWLNGHRLGHHRSGYTPFRYDLTDVAEYGGENVLAVRVDATEFEGWWYEGAGIYRHVWLVKTSPVHVAPHGVFVTAALEEAPQVDRAEVTVRTTLVNRGAAPTAAEVESVVVDAEGRPRESAAATVDLPLDEPVELTQQISLQRPTLWSVERPHLYRLVTTVRCGEEVVDRVETTFGLRTLRFDAERGFFLNGQPVKLRGTCNHQDHAGVGIAMPDSVMEYRLRRLQEMGCNAYRCAHNPPAPELLDLCDRMGLLVMDENRYLGSTEENLAELEAMILRDRNHPSVIMWSMCNEEALQGTEVGGRIMRAMIRLTHRLDPTRPVTCAISGEWGGEYSEVLDVAGINYSPQQYDEYHAHCPDQPLVASETSSAVTTRGIYRTDPERGYLSAYDVNCPEWGNLAEVAWKAVADRDFVAGTFVWTGLDYRGEPTPYGWPCINSHFGIMDTCGFAKDNFHYYQAWWTQEPRLHLLPHWNWPGREGEEIAVWAHGNCERVELFLNGESLGAQQMPQNGHLEWSVPYAPGRLEAVGYCGDQEAARAVRETTGAPLQITLHPDRAVLRADGEDVVPVRVAVEDEHGREVPITDNLIEFRVEGLGRLRGVGNGNPTSHEPDQAPRRRLFNGLAQVLVQTGCEPGEITLLAEGAGLLAAELVLVAEPAAVRPAVPPLPPPAGD